MEREAEDAGYWREKAYNIGIPSLENFGIRSANRFSPIDKFLDLAERCAQRGVELERKKEEILEAINKVSDPNYRKVLKCRYISGHDLLRVAEEIGYSPGRTYHLHREALEKFNIPKC